MYDADLKHSYLNSLNILYILKQKNKSIDKNLVVKKWRVGEV